MMTLCWRMTLDRNRVPIFGNQLMLGTLGQGVEGDRQQWRNKVPVEAFDLWVSEGAEQDYNK